MKNNFTFYKRRSFFVSLCFIFFIFITSTSFANIGITLDGLANGASFPQGSGFQWQITGLSTGATVSNEIWVDANNNGVIDAGDFVFVSFNETDGASSNKGPGDDDGIANDTISTSLSGIVFPAGNYIFKTSSGSDSATSAFTITAMPSPTFSVNGSVKKNGTGLADIAVKVSDSSTEYYALTDANGNYTITTNILSGTNVTVHLADVPNFNATLTGYIISPSQVNLTLSADVSNIDFIVATGKIVTGVVTDTLGNPIQGISISIYPTSGGNNNYNGQTDANGIYVVAVDTGHYTVQFGDTQNPNGYLLTYYNQKYVSWISDSIIVTAATDSIKNINAVLKRGALIMGTFTKNGVPVQGNITAYGYNVAGNNPLYETWHDSTQNFYYLFVPPGVYSIYFTTQENNGAITGVYYKQTYFWPGKAVTVNSLSDTIQNINVDFGTVPLPKKFVFIGNGNWNSSNNWSNNLMPPYTLPAGDTIVINGGQCSLNVMQTVSPGGFLIIKPGANLIIPGELKLQ